MSRWIHLLTALSLCAAPALGGKLQIDSSTSRGSALVILTKPAAAKRVPPLANTWAWPQTFPGRGNALTPDLVTCNLLTVKTAGDTHVPGLVVDWRIDLLRDDTVIHSSSGSGRTEKSTFVVTESLEELDLEHPDLVEVHFAFQNGKRLAFARLDCLARAVAPSD